MNTLSSIPTYKTDFISWIKLILSVQNTMKHMCHRSLESEQGECRRCCLKAWSFGWTAWNDVKADLINSILMPRCYKIFSWPENSAKHWLQHNVTQIRQHNVTLSNSTLQSAAASSVGEQSWPLCILEVWHTTQMGSWSVKQKSFSFSPCFQHKLLDPDALLWPFPCWKASHRFLRARLERGLFLDALLLQTGQLQETALSQKRSKQRLQKLWLHGKRTGSLKISQHTGQERSSMGRSADMSSCRYCSSRLYYAFDISKGGTCCLVYRCPHSAGFMKNRADNVYVSTCNCRGGGGV